MVSVVNPPELTERLEHAADALIADVRRRHAGQDLRCPLMIELERALKDLRKGRSYRGVPHRSSA